MYKKLETELQRFLKRKFLIVIGHNIRSLFTFDAVLEGHFHTGGNRELSRESTNADR